MHAISSQHSSSAAAHCCLGVVLPCRQDTTTAADTAPMNGVAATVGAAPSGTGTAAALRRAQMSDPETPGTPGTSGTLARMMTAVHMVAVVHGATVALVVTVGRVMDTCATDLSTRMTVAAHGMSASGRETRRAADHARGLAPGPATAGLAPPLPRAPHLAVAHAMALVARRTRGGGGAKRPTAMWTWRR